MTNVVRRRATLAACLAALLLAGLPSATAQGATPRRVSGTSTLPGDWDMWGYDQQRTGFNPNETVLGPATASGLHLLWQFPFAAKSDNAPVFASGVDIEGTPTDVVYAGDRTGAFDAVNAATGTVIWSVNLGTTTSVCFGRLGVTSTAVIDRSDNLIYVAGGDGAVYALDLATGQIQPGWPVQVTGFSNEYIWSALAEENGDLYVPVASGCDRGGVYYGRIDRVNTSTAAIDATFYVIDGPETGVSGGGIWGWGGVSIDAATGDLFEVSGNGYPDAEYEHDLFAESLVRLSSDLTVDASSYPGLTGSDVDFGSTPIEFTARQACGPQLFVMDKDGEVFLYYADDIGNGPIDEVQVTAEGGLIGVAAYSPSDRRIYMGDSGVSADGLYTPGLLSFRIRRDCTLRRTWHGAFPVTDLSTAPVTANGVLYWGDGSGNRLFAIDLASHRRLWNSGNLHAPPQTEPIVVDGHVYASVGKNLYAFGL